MPLFEVTVVGRGLWIEIDHEVQRVMFRVARVVDAPDQETAADRALGLILADPKARHAPGKPPPDLSIEQIVTAKAVPRVNPGIRFSPEEG